MRKIPLLTTLILFLCAPLWAQEGGTFYLKKDETVSDLLYNRLKLSPIYGKNRHLEKVLIYNKLNLGNAKSLPVGHPIIVPDFLMDESTQTPTVTLPTGNTRPVEIDQVPPSEDESPKTPEIKLPTLKNQHYFSVRGGMYAYSGKSNEGSSFSAGGPIGVIEYGYLFRGHEWTSSLNGSLFALCVDCTARNESVLSGTIGASVMRKVSERFSFGGGAEVARDFFIQEKNRVDKIAYGIIPKLFFGMEFMSNSYFGRVKVGQSLSANLDNDSRAEQAPFAGARLTRRITPRWDIGIDLTHERRKVEGFDQGLSTLFFVSEWKF